VSAPPDFIVEWVNCVSCGGRGRFDCEWCNGKGGEYRQFYACATCGEFECPCGGENEKDE
jgi:hypothetical protein